MRRFILLLSILFMNLSSLSHAEAKNLQAYIDNPEVVGEARLKMFFFKIYDASLIAQNGVFEQDQPFALKLKYLRDFDGKDIASRSVDEMRKQGMQDEVKLAKWFQQMKLLFPNVKEGQTITGIVDANQVSHFYFDSQHLGKVEDKEFSEWFFNIWLAENTSQPDMRLALIGENK